MIGYIKRILDDQDMSNDGRVYALPFLASAWALGTSSGIVAIVHGGGVIDVVSTLAIIGFSLYTGNKYLKLKGQIPTVIEKALEGCDSDKE